MPTYRFAGITIYADKSRLEIDGRPVTLSPTEFLILKLFVKEPGRFYSRDEIQSFVWGDNEPVSARTIDVNISRLRKKLGNYGANIVSCPGTGYGLV